MHDSVERHGYRSRLPQLVRELPDLDAFHAEHNAEGFAVIGAAATVAVSLVVQIGEQVDFLRFLPRPTAQTRTGWWIALVAAGPGWIIPGALKLLAGSFLAFLALQHEVPLDHAAEPTQMYLTAFNYVFTSPEFALIATGLFVVLSQLKINVTNAYAGSLAWSNFFARVTHSHPGRVVWVPFISGGLKALSPAGNRVRPMIAIIMQGLLFGGTVQGLGWNFLAIGLGGALG